MTTSYQERWERIRTAVSLGRPDQVPVVLEYASLAAREGRILLQSGCDIPNNARLENVQGMLGAATS